MEEIWKPIERTKHYEVSNMGRIRRTIINFKIGPKEISQIRSARAFGATWKSIADAIGVTPRAVISALNYVPKRGAHREPNRIIKAHRGSNGYAFARLCENGIPFPVRFHLEVAKVFLPPKPTPKHEVNHKDGDKMNPQATNLEWMTRSENMVHFHRQTKPRITREDLKYS